jgi:pyruvate/2-oxoglutarate dehydrogenase complex dihydrolipoamide dehydrogenase (E3) component
MAAKYDAIVIGAGQAGVPLASALAKSGRKTAIIEREHIGVPNCLYIPLHL